MRVKITKATQAHALRVADLMREEDAAEVVALTGATPLACLTNALKHSLFSWTWMIDGEPVFIFGIAMKHLLGDTAIPWAMGTPLAERHAKAFLKQSRKWLRTFLKIAPRLENYVDARHAKAIRWLRWMGFTIHPATPVGVAGLPFHRFEIRR